MGLDMYLTRKIYLGTSKCYAFCRNTKTKIIIETNEIKIERDDAIEEYTIREGYWRKANHIHKWFVDNVQNGYDDCNEYYVEVNKIKELKTICQRVLENRSLAKTMLPRNEGFYFGSLEYGDDYFYELIKTIKIIDAVLAGKARDKQDGIFSTLEYSSSW